jgi:shikimate kinase
LSPGNLFLVGYQCTGKSSVGRSLAATLSLPFIDTDSLVVSENGMSIREIVISRGWEAFRRLEHTALQQVCTMDRRVVATGGGIVLDADNVKLMKKSGRIIWLRASPKTIKARMLQDKASKTLRPALTSTDNISEIEETLAKRAPLYQHAMDFSVDTDHRGVDEICDFIIRRLKAGSG